MLTATGAQDHGENTGRRLQAATYEPMRISVQYTGFSDEPVYATQASFVRNTLMPRATRRLSEMLSITPVVGPLYAHRDCTRYDTSSSPAKCTAYAASTDCSNFGGEYPIVFSAAQLGADQVWSTSSRSWSTLPAGSGFANADFVVFATILQSDICGTASTGGTIAYAWGCQRDSATDRPTIARINFCPQMMSSYYGANIDSGVDVVMHELAHGLGFSADSFPLWRYGDSARTPRTPRNPTYPFVPSSAYRADFTCGGQASWDYLPAGNTVSFFAERGMEACTASSVYPSSNCVARIVTPAVQAASQAYFNCPTLPGAELENLQSLDDCSIMGSHWEFRVFAGEAMCPYDLSMRQGFSAVTLAVFEDSGWGYRANYSAADDFVKDLDWGYKQGCGMAAGKCVDTINGALSGQGEGKPHFWPANVRDGSLCRIDRSGYAGANVSDYGRALPTQYQYFPGQPTLGGGDRFGTPSADFCPMIQPQSGNDRMCTDSHSSGELNDLGMRVGAASMCMSSSLRRTGASTVSKGVGCYQTACNSDGSMAVTVTRPGGGGTLSATCVTAGQQLAFAGYGGSVTCPDAPSICGPRAKDMSGVVIPAALPASASPAPSASRTPGPPSASPSASAVPVIAPGSGQVVVSLCFASSSVSALSPTQLATQLALTTGMAYALRCDIAVAAGAPVTVATVTIQGYFPATLGTAGAVSLPEGDVRNWGNVSCSGVRRQLQALLLSVGEDDAAASAGAVSDDSFSAGRWLQASTSTGSTGMCVFARVAMPPSSANAAADATTVRSSLNQALASSLSVTNAFQRAAAAFLAGNGAALGSAGVVVRAGYISGASASGGGGGGSGVGSTDGVQAITGTGIIAVAAGVAAGAIFLIGLALYCCNCCGNGEASAKPTAQQQQQQQQQRRQQQQQQPGRGAQPAGPRMVPYVPGAPPPPGMILVAVDADGFPIGPVAQPQPQPVYVPSPYGAGTLAYGAQAAPQQQGAMVPTYAVAPYGAEAVYYGGEPGAADPRYARPVSMGGPAPNAQASRTLAAYRNPSLRQTNPLGPARQSRGAL